MNATRWILWLMAVGFVGFGLAFLWFPHTLALAAGIVLTSPDARADFMAGYGGLQLGVGAFLAHCASSPGRIRIGLLAAGLSLAGLATARAAGILTGEPVSPLIWLLLGVEAGAAALSWWGALRPVDDRVRT